MILLSKVVYYGVTVLYVFSVVDLRLMLVVGTADSGVACVIKGGRTNIILFL